MKKFSMFLCMILLLSPGLLALQEQEARVYELKWRGSEEIAEILRGFDIPFRVSPTFNTISVMGGPDVHAVVEAAIKRFDVPARNLEVRFFLLRASASEGGIKNGIPSHLAEVIEEIASLTRYNTFQLVDTPTLRATEGKKAEISGQGELTYEIRLFRNSIVDKEGTIQIRFDPIEIQFQVPIGITNGKVVYGGSAGVRTSLTVGNEETVVLGISRLQQAARDEDIAVITILSARLVEP